MWYKGALTRGDRRAATGADLMEFNFDTPYGRTSLRTMYSAICQVSTLATACYVVYVSNVWWSVSPQFHVLMDFCSVRPRTHRRQNRLDTVDFVDWRQNRPCQRQNWPSWTCSTLVDFVDCTGDKIDRAVDFVASVYGAGDKLASSWILIKHGTAYYVHKHTAYEYIKF